MDGCAASAAGHFEVGGRSPRLTQRTTRGLVPRRPAQCSLAPKLWRRAGDDDLLEGGLEAFDRWPQATEELYGPFWRWCNTQLQVVQTIPRVGPP